MRTRMRQRGFSLVEIMVALTILMIIILGLANTTISFLHETTTDTVRVRAQSFADMRIAEVRGYSDYAGLVATFNSTDTPESGFTRVTKVVRDISATTPCSNPPPGCPKNDVTRITVTVNNAGLSVPIARTLAISSF
ncbi:MAG TPA: prepilin-type N-terminal cleavage/methylation domain-containing protein [Gemmatimonadaceae bacterium]|nr:prepilin-type N-terminal cleavage/methylation domain-containing protein [Gemmatimonadaceae bacterium]